MRTTRCGVIIVGLLFSQIAVAGDPSQLFGKWIQRFSNGAGMVTEFTPTTISYYTVDPSGNRTMEPDPKPVSYRDLGQTIAIDFEGEGGILAVIKDQQTMLLDFPGVAAYTLTRMPAE